MKFQDEREQEYNQNDYIKPLLIMYGVVLLLALLTVNITSSQMSDEELYDEAVSILTEDYEYGEALVDYSNYASKY